MRESLLCLDQVEGGDGFPPCFAWLSSLLCLASYLLCLVT